MPHEPEVRLGSVFGGPAVFQAGRLAVAYLQVFSQTERAGSHHGSARSVWRPQ